VDVALLDGTFWADGEVPGRDMSAFPHPRISKSLDRFAALPAPERSKIHFIHFNHTNPAARPGSPEGRAVEAAGSHLAEEGQVFPLGDDTGSG
jgi:pyrroloquinoline quinone biosynthesis protein B